MCDGLLMFEKVLLFLSFHSAHTPAAHIVSQPLLGVGPRALRPINQASLQTYLEYKDPLESMFHTNLSIYV